MRLACNCASIGMLMSFGAQAVRPRSHCALIAAAVQSGPEEGGMQMRLMQISSKDMRPCQCALTANAMQPGPNEVGMQLRLKRISHVTRGTCGATEK